MSRSTKSCCSRSPADRAGALLLALALAWTLAGCGSPAGQEPDTLRLGVALYSQDDTFIASLTQELERMVQEAEVARGLGDASSRVITYDATAKSLEIGNVKTMNIVLLGTLSTLTDIAPELWEQAITKYVPAKALEKNIAAFRAGREVK